ncbi:MAG: beta-ketoacyl synthase N-terminal-like domain-containing protein [Streptosporangiaceae bacterium]|jgi:3-oxoacyl-[acyl-carrier-protein] synthase II
MNERIALTGTGVLTAAGAGAGPLFEVMAAGETLLGTWPGRSGKPLPWPTSLIDPGQAPWPSGPPWNSVRKYANPTAHIAVSTARQAVAAAGLAGDFDALRGGIVMAVSSSGGDELSDLMPRLAVAAQTDARSLPKFLYDEVPDYSYIRGIPSQLGQFAAMASGFSGSNVAVYGEAGAGGLGALALAHRLIGSGELDAVLVVGVAGPLSVSNLAALDQQDRLAEKALPGCGPFDAGRAGVLAGQGAAALMVERESTARCRGADILAFVDSCEVLAAATRRQALDLAVSTALGSMPAPAGLWWASACGSVPADLEEYEVVSHHLAVQATSSKGTIGTAFEASALIDIALSAHALARQQAPPVGLLAVPDTQLTDLDAVTGGCRPADGLAGVLVTALSHGDSSGAAGAAGISKGTGG